jgi:hypothetical protein
MHPSFVRIAIACLVALVTLAAALPVVAQEHRALIRGVVIDPAARGIPDVEVRATREETNEVRRVRTDDRGRFSVTELEPGTYRVDVEHAGYGPFVARAELTLNQDFRLEVALQLGSVV